MSRRLIDEHERDPFSYQHWEREVKGPLSHQGRDEIGPGLDGGADGVVLVGRYPDGLSGEGDVVVVAGRVVALELTVVGVAGEVSLGNTAHRGREGRICHDRRSARVECGDRGCLERDDPEAFAGRLVDEVHLAGVVLAVPDDRCDLDTVAAGIAGALEGIVVDDDLDEVVKRRYAGERGREFPKRRFVYGLFHKVCHGLYSCLHLPGNMTDTYRVDAGGYEPDFIKKPGSGSDSSI